VPSRPYPDSGSRLVLLPSGKAAAGAIMYVYADAALTVPAQVYSDVAGAKGPLVVPGVDGRVQLTLDAYGRQPRYWGPDSGQDTLYVVINGVGSPVDADYDPRLDALETALADVLARLVVLEAGAGVVQPGQTPFAPLSAGLLSATDLFTGITFTGGLLTVDDLLVPGVSYAGGVLTVTTA
jgi:hypothetical protein